MHGSWIKHCLSIVTIGCNSPHCHTLPHHSTTNHNKPPASEHECPASVATKNSSWECMGPRLITLGIWWYLYVFVYLCNFMYICMCLYEFILYDPVGDAVWYRLILVDDISDLQRTSNYAVQSGSKRSSGRTQSSGQRMNFARDGMALQLGTCFSCGADMCWTNVLYRFIMFRHIWIYLDHLGLNWSVAFSHMFNEPISS